MDYALRAPLLASLFLIQAITFKPIPLAGVSAKPWIPVSRIEEPDWAKKHERTIKSLPKDNYELVFLGDSITENWTAAKNSTYLNYKPIWNYYYADRHPLNLGSAGDTTGNLLWRMQNGELTNVKPKVAVILIGTNNTSEKHKDWTAEDNTRGITDVVDQMRLLSPDTQILLLGILPSDRSVEKTALNRKINAALAKKYSSPSQNKVHFMNLDALFEEKGRIKTCLFSDPLATPPQGAVHPTAEGQALIAAAIEPFVAKMSGDTQRPPFAGVDTRCGSRSW